jgi:hypothetical protein
MKIMPSSCKLLLCASLLLTTNSLKSIEGFSLIPAGAFTMGESLDGIASNDRDENSFIINLAGEGAR